MENSQEPIVELLLRPDFISAIAKLLWPLVAAFAVWIFRSDIRSLLERLDSAKFGKNELRFSQQVSQLKNTVKDVVTETERIAGVSDRETIQHGSTPKLEQRYTLTEHDWKKQDREEMAMARRFVLPDQPLLSRSLTWKAGVDLLSLVKNNPLEAVLMIHGELERAIREILVSDGVTIKNNMPLSKLASILQSRRKLSPEFDVAVRQFVNLRNQIAHLHKKIPPQELIEVANSGLKLLDLLGRIPREHIYIQRSQISVFSDEACTILATEYEGLHLMFPAMPGRTGAAMSVVSQKRHYYRIGEMVSSEWGDMTRTDLWMTGLDDKPRKIPAGNAIFMGRHTIDLMTN